MLNYFSITLYFLSEPCTEMSENPLMYWQINSNKFPLLSNLARKHLAIPATSAPVERLFSIAGKVFRPVRCRLNDKTFEQLMIIKCNAKTVLQALNKLVYIIYCLIIKVITKCNV